VQLTNALAVQGMFNSLRRYADSSPGGAGIGVDDLRPAGDEILGTSSGYLGHIG